MTNHEQPHSSIVFCKKKEKQQLCLTAHQLCVVFFLFVLFDFLLHLLLSFVVVVACHITLLYSLTPSLCPSRTCFGKLDLCPSQHSTKRFNLKRSVEKENSLTYWRQYHTSYLLHISIEFARWFKPRLKKAHAVIIKKKPFSWKIITVFNCCPFSIAQQVSRLFLEKQL